LLEAEFTDLSESEIELKFGGGFAEQISQLTTGKWHGGIRSGFGLHLVYISGRTDGRLPPLAEVREELRRRWENAQRDEANQKLYLAMIERYTITVE
jgi:hypothetical protein